MVPSLSSRPLLQLSSLQRDVVCTHVRAQRGGLPLDDDDDGAMDAACGPAQLFSGVVFSVMFGASIWSLFPPP
jgi:hypothetical protein